MKHFNKIFALVILGLFIAGTSFAKSEKESFEKKMFQALGSSNQGTDFYLTFHPCHESNGNKKNEHNLYFTSDVATSIRVTIPGKEFEKRVTTIPYGIVKVGLSPSQGQCYQKDIPDIPLPHMVFRGFAIIVEADDPIVVYGMTRYSLTSDGFLGIPVSGYGTQYVVESYNDYTSDVSGSSYYTSYFSVVGVTDKTEVTCYLGGYHTSYTPGGDRWTPGKKRKKILNKGDVWLVGVAGDYSDLTGTLVESNKPVSVISGNFRAGIPISFASRDYLIEHMLPTHTWGYKYHVTPIINRKAGSIIRIFALENKTDIYRDGQQWARVKQGEGGTELEGGYVEKVASSKGVGPRPVTISADTRIHVSQYNPTGYFDGSTTDPFMIALTPIDQYQTEIIFCTPGFQGEGFQDNYLNLCYRSTVDGNIPDDMEFGYGTSGQVQWRSLSAIAQSPGAPFVDPDVTDGRDWKIIQIKLWDPQGVYGIRSANPFAAYGYGFESADSYGYPLSAALRDLSKPDIWAPKPSYKIDCYGDVFGEVYDEPYQVDSLRSNLAAIAMDKRESYNYSLEILEKNFIPGTTVEADWALYIENYEADAKAVMLFTDRAGNDTTITIEYKGTEFKISPRIANWGQLAFNDPAKTITMKLINESEKNVVVDSIVLLSSATERTWDYNGFTIDPKIYTDGILPKLMAAGEELEFDVTFSPASIKDLIDAGKGSFIDSVGIKAYYDENIEDYCYYKYKAVVKATTGKPYIEVAEMDFGKRTVYTTHTLEVPVYNNGNSDLNVTGYTLPAGFAENIYIQELEGLGPNDAFVIPAKGGTEKNYKMLTVDFTPNKVGMFPDQIVFTSDADTSYANHDPICEIIGEGIQPGLQATGTEWENMRAHLDIYDNTGNPYGNSSFPYDYKTRKNASNGSTYGLSIFNDGSQAVKITAVKIESEQNAEYFEVSKQSLLKYLNDNVINKLIDTGLVNTREWLVDYNPRTAGTHFVVITFEAIVNGFEVSTTCEFKGNAIYPDALPNPYMFTDTEDRETAIVGNENKDSFKKQIKIINNPERADADVLRIYDITTDNANLISLDPANTSANQVFEFDKDAIFADGSPVVISVGDSLVFTATFYPKRTAGYNGHPVFDANITYITDAEETEYISNWTAKAVRQAAISEGIYARQCNSYSANPADDTQEKRDNGIFYDADYKDLVYPISITNTGDDVLSVEEIQFVSPELFAFVDDKYNSPFTLEAGEIANIDVYYASTTTIPTNNATGLKFITKNVVIPIITNTVDVKTTDYGRKSKALLNGNEYKDGEVFKINYEKTPGKDIANKFTYTVEIDERAIPDEETSKGMEYLIGNTNFEVVIEYDRNYLGASFDNAKDQVKCSISSELKSAGYSITEAIEDSIAPHQSRIIVRIESDNPIKIDTKFTMLKIDFTVFQNYLNLDLNPELAFTPIAHVINSSNPCLEMEGNEAALSLQTVCAQNTRLIEYGPNDFSEINIVPSPMGSQGGTMTYELGFECLTNIEVYNEEGKLVATPVNTVKTAGKHTTRISTSNLSSGVYFVKLKAGPFENVKRIIINK